MLVRKSYYEHKRYQIKSLVLEIANHLNKMIEQSDEFLLYPTKDNEDIILQIENDVDIYEKEVERYILEIISLEQLNSLEIKWLFSIGRIIRELERIGDQLVNILTISNTVDTRDIRPKIRNFFNHEQNMTEWLIIGIQKNNSEKLDDVVNHDVYVNTLNKEIYQDMVKFIQKEEHFTESKLSMVIISRFLERIGDHLVNAAKVYKGAINNIND